MFFKEDNMLPRLQIFGLCFLVVVGLVYGITLAVMLYLRITARAKFHEMPAHTKRHFNIVVSQALAGIAIACFAFYRLTSLTG
jgi:hypothetical protein